MDADGRIGYEVYRMLLVVRLSYRVALILCCLASMVATSGCSHPVAAATPQSAPPEWAYGTGPAEALKAGPPATPGEKAAADKLPLHLPGSTFAFTRKEANDPFNPADWYP